MSVKIVEIKGFEFVHETVVIKVGDRVKWVNKDEAEHNAQRDLVPIFNTGLLAKDEESEEIIFSQASDNQGFEYFCAPHATFMKGHVVVTLAGANSSTYSRQEALLSHH